MPQSSKGYTYTSSGTNSQVNFAEILVASDDPETDGTCFTSNGSYYYSNPNGSTYYNSGSGSSTYTPPSGSGKK
ncbi:hypothetical protein N7468_002719 [Penicillium chermesinum]|uniref:Uncharacterized protein n=1 Tax=Penicillium chermesinum TaxID=63820 RepID=A0A9W9PKP8_9EURO|nr:uncharacterized protein N7468_002719 [Penicillium chermesinum]KAJ5247736.1 hypothetical protein N7468_002719 [Penicillium chermesinum]KAJ6151502.1 hypothetical protein N7470_007099 [Penicillium chermesinum]